jgi:hypothetical protein
MKKKDDRLFDLFRKEFGPYMQSRISMAEDKKWDKLKLIYSSCIDQNQKIEITKKRISKIQKKLKKCPNEIAIYLSELLNPYALNRFNDRLDYFELINILAINFFTANFYEDLEMLNQKKTFLEVGFLKKEVYDIDWDYYFRSTVLFENQILLYEFEYYFTLGSMLVSFKEFDFIQKNNFEKPQTSENTNEEGEKQRNFEKAIEVNFSPEAVGKKSKSFSPSSFTYKYLATYPEKLNDLHDILVKKKFIAPQTNIRDFKKIFSGDEVVTKVIWTGNISELYFFIKYIHSDAKKVEYLKLKHWAVTINCFELLNEEEFTVDRLRWQKKPSNAYIIKNIINKL